MPFENTFCNRDGCGHNVPDHPNDGPCLKCNCVGFFSDHGYRDPLADYYVQKIIDIHVAFKNDLDAARHMIDDFPVMASKFFQEKQKEVDEFWKKLANEKPELASRVNEKIQLFNQYGREGIKKLDKEESEIITKLTHDGANRDRSLEFMKIMILSFLTTRFREFVRELLNMIYEIEFKHKGKHQSLKRSELQSEAFKISELDIKKMSKKLAEEWKLQLDDNKNFDQFTEFFYRRNAFIHSNGYPDQKYREKTGFQGSYDKLELTKDYLSQLVDTFFAYSETINEFFLEKECGVVNITKKGNSHHIDLTKGGGKIIPIKDQKQ